MSTLTWKYCHFDEIFINGCTGSCHFDNFQCSENFIKMSTFPFQWSNVGWLDQWEFQPFSNGYWQSLAQPFRWVSFLLLKLCNCKETVKQSTFHHTHQVAHGYRLLYSPSLVAPGLSMGYKTWPAIGWHHTFVIGWSKYRLGLPRAPLHFGLTWPVGIRTVSQTPVTVPLHSPNGRQMPAVRVCKGTVKESNMGSVLGGWSGWIS